MEALLAALRARLEERVPPHRLEGVRAFADAYTRRLGGDDLAELSVEELLGQVLGAFELADGRDGREVAVRAFNPNLKEHGYTAAGSVLETNTPDSPFLFDSVHEELRARGLGIRRVVHPVIGVVRTAEGRIDRIVHAKESTSRESVMHFELDRRLSDDELARIEEAALSVLGDVRLAVRDFPAMREAVGRMVETARAGSVRYPPAEVAEAVAFLEWLLEDNFVFLGYRSYELVQGPRGRSLAIVRGSGLGILSKEDWSTYREPVPLSAIEPGLRARVEGGDLLIYAKTNRESTVHRRARMDDIGIRRVSASGEILGEERLLGLFTSKAYAEPASRTPALHRKLHQVLDSVDLVEGSHDYKTLVSLFDGFPKDELFAAPTEELRDTLTGLLQLPERQSRVFLRRDVLGRSLSILVALPRDRFSTDVRRAVQKLLRSRFEGAGVDDQVSFGDGRLAMIHLTVHPAPEPEGAVAVEDLEREIAQLARTWEDRLRDRLVELHGPARGWELFERWEPRLPEAYRAVTAPELAAEDLRHFEELEAGDEAFVVALVNVTRDGETLTRVRLFKVGGRIQLSDFVPILEDLGLRVVDEVPHHLAGDADRRFLHDFGVLGSDGQPLDVEESGARIAECIVAAWRGDAESDSLNRLVVTAGLTWRDVAILRAYRKYHHRVSAGFPVEYKNDAFAAHPAISAKLVRLFEARFDPARCDMERAESLRREILEDLDAVRSLEQDRILRHHLGLIDATVRTNAYRSGRTWLSFKFRSAEVPEMPRPTPLFEIFVYSPEMEGIHLRGGRVARGGIRWSDRRQDYRTEVLGLMKAQMVKNAVIVPTGSKGGFVLKRSIQDPTALHQEVRRQYVVFMRGLLDLTDNLVDGRVVHPPEVVVRDDDDPYLVVAADKGTAALSDTANEVAAEYGFWLGDAFASGGSSGYDHKKLGITARGAWESVKRHFREMGTDVMNEPFTVVGIGDMSGDVFGNGMLLSDQICLVAAFDHRHVFIDPNPNPAAGFAERSRLFHLPGSTWDDYDRSKISPGGGVWPRTAKHIRLSPEARLALGNEGELLTPDEVIRAILRAPVDLLWNGGIGTYVKASTESHAEVEDRANDAVRVNGAELRCRVVAEGGNLGFTQRGRIEYALAGGRINTDFVDNSAGVDCSDHEVNLKILLGLAMRRGLLTLEERNDLLREVEQDVVAHVLYDNFLQAQIISQEAEQSVHRTEAYEDLMQALEAEGILDRALEALPSAEELAERRRANRGLTRPELATLLAYAKQALSDALLSSNLPDSGYLERDLRAYFPSKVVERFADLLPLHPLRRELIATLVANDVVNSQGITFVSRLMAETGSEAADVVRAYRIARDVTGAVERWEAIEALAGRVPPQVLNELMAGVDRLVEVLSRWYLAHAPGRLGRAIEEGLEPFRRFAEVVPSAAPDGWRQARQREAWRLIDLGVPEEIAVRHAHLPALVHGPNVARVCERTGRPLDEVVRAFFVVGEAAFVDRLEARLSAVPTATRWHRWAVQAMEDDLLDARSRIAERALSGSEPIDRAVAVFLESRADGVARLRRFMRALEADDAADVPALTVAVRQVLSLAS